MARGGHTGWAERRTGRTAGSGFRAALMTALLVLSPVLLPIPVAAQQLGLAQSAILTVATERLFTDSEFGRRVAREIEAESAVLTAENRRIEAELTVEEQELTSRRPEMAPEAFRALADAFDEKVQTIRRQQEAKARALNQLSDAAQVDFLQAARPILVALMREAGAAVILERSSVFLSSNATDVTDVAISRINAAIGDGAPEPATED